MTTSRRRSRSEGRADGDGVASGEVPGMPGLPVPHTSALRASVWRGRARAPCATTRTVGETALTLWRRHELLAPRATPTRRTGTRSARPRRPRSPARRGQVLTRGCRREIGTPAGQLLVDGRDLVEDRLVVRRVLEALAVRLVGDADLDGLERVEDVELCEATSESELSRTACAPSRRRTTRTGAASGVVPNSWPRSTAGRRSRR